MESRKLFRLCLAVLFGFCSLILSTAAHGQGAVITGKVTTDQGREIEGANVTIPELNISVGTNAAGNFTITIPPARLNGGPATLRVRAIGYVPRSSLIALSEGPRTANFALAQDINRLEAVVTTGVTGATSQLKLPFTVSRIDSSDMKVPAANPLSQLAGKVPGAQIVAASGRPGASPAVILRGPTAITGAGRGQQPLFIVDGVILADQGSLGGGGLPDVNPLDIESVEVIKGAAASSLYGARAGNGVINIRTKSGIGANEGIRIGARTEFGTSDVEHHIDIAQRNALLLDETGTKFCVNSKQAGVTSQPYQCLQTIDYAAEAYRINDQGGDFPLATFVFPIDPGSGLVAANPALRDQFLVNRWPGTNYDAVSQFVRPKPVLNNSMDMRGKYGQTSFYASASNLDQGGSIKYLNGFQRTTGRINLDQQIGNKWTASLTSYYSHGQNDGYFQEGFTGNAFFGLTRVPPIVNLDGVDSQGRLFIRPNIQGGGLQNANPLYALQNDYQITRVEHFIGGGTLRYQPTTWADLEGNISYDGASSNWNNFDNKGYRTTSGPSTTNQGYTEQATQKGQSYNSSATLNIRHEFGSAINSRTSFRYLFERQDNDFRDASASKLIVVGIPSLANAIDQATKSITSTVSSVRSIGFFAAQDFDIADRYIVGGLVRRDGSSLFGRANRWKTFGRGSFAWRVSQEPWWPVAALNELKLRASIGTAGGRPGFSSQYETYNLSGGQVTPSTLGNRFLKPETIREVELGVDAEVFHRIGINLTHATSNAFDQILLVPAPAATGFGQQYQNAGVLQNKTWEASINVPILDNFHDVSYSTRFIYSTNRAVITHLYVPSFNFGATAQNTGALFLAKEGERYGTFYGRAFATSCSQLPSQLAASCGTPGAAFQRNSDGWIVWVGQGNTVNDGITKNLWNARLPANSPFYSATSAGKNGFMNPAIAINWGMPIILRDSTGTAVQTALGNPLPNFRWGLSQNLSYKGFTAYALVDAAIGQHVYNQGRGWSYLDFLEGREDQTGKTVEAAKPIGYYYRAGAPDGVGIGGFYDQLGANNAVVEDASYAKLREVNIGYHIGSFGRLGGDWSMALIGRNLHTWTKYTGFDPEVGLGAVSGTRSTNNGAGSAAINAIDAFTFPNLRSYTFSLSTSF